MIRKNFCNSYRVVPLISLFFFHSLSFLGQTSGFANNAKEEDKLYEVWIVQEAWHTGIVFAIDDVDTDHWPEITNYKDRNFIDVGWGDERFYQAHGNPVFLAARAILWPTQSVMQIFAFNTPVRSAYGRESRILRVPLTPEQFEALAGFVSDSYILDESGNPFTSKAYGETEHYFLATRNYYLFRTCNTWVAIAFKQAGFDVRTFFVLNANQLYRQLSRIPGAEFIRE
jgi:uncharacterized protein (TIGR02117 family)